jgi:hypothetical protein
LQPFRGRVRQIPLFRGGEFFRGGWRVRRADRHRAPGFQHLLEKHNHGEQIFEVVKARMCRRHLTERKKREPEMNQTCRGKLWNHAAYVHDPAAAADLMHGEKSCFATISIRDPGWSLIEPLGRRP